jgi:nicotinamide-nucleotide amidase
MLPSRCEVLKNARGTAPGMLFKTDGKILISMPGVPNEMKGIMEDHVLPLLKGLMAESDSVTVFKTLLTNGIPESNLADLLGDTDEFLKGTTLAFLPSYHGVRLRIGSVGESFKKGEEEIARVEKYIRSKAEKFIYGEGDQNLALAVGNLLKEKNKTISLAESCTGGLLGAALTDAAGSSQYFMGSIICYSNEAKIELLNVPSETILNNGAVSCEVAEVLAKNVRLRFKTDYGMSITGIAGPGGGTAEKPVGTVWIGIADEHSVHAKKFIFGTERMVNRELSVGAALGILLKDLQQ